MTHHDTIETLCQRRDYFARIADKLSRSGNMNLADLWDAMVADVSHEIGCLKRRGRK